MMARGVTRRGQWGHNSPGSESLYGRRMTVGEHRIIAGDAEKSQHCHNSSFSTVNLLPKEVRFDHGAPNLLLAPGAI